MISDDYDIQNAHISQKQDGRNIHEIISHTLF